MLDSQVLHKHQRKKRSKKNLGPRTLICSTRFGKIPQLFYFVHLFSGISGKYIDLPQFNLSGISNTPDTILRKSRRKKTAHAAKRANRKRKRETSPIFLNCTFAKRYIRVRSGANVCTSYRPWQMIKSEPTLAIWGVDTAENRPDTSAIWLGFARPDLGTFLSLLITGSTAVAEKMLWINCLHGVTPFVWKRTFFSQ